MVTLYGPGCSLDIFCPPLAHRFWGSPIFLARGGLFLLGVKLLKVEADQSPPCRVEVKNAWSFSSTLCTSDHGLCSYIFTTSIFVSLLFLHYAAAYSDGYNRLSYCVIIKSHKPYLDPNEHKFIFPVFIKIAFIGVLSDTVL